MQKVIDNPKCTKEQAVKALRSQWARARADAARPRYHFCPMSGWMNDPNGAIWENETLHFFYLEDPFDEAGMSEAILPDGTLVKGEQKPNRFWGHARTKDFLKWDYLPMALGPERNSGELKPISGSVLHNREDNTYFMAFTSVRMDGTRNRQLGAFSKDGMQTWVRCKKELAAPPDFLEIENDWRDPYLFCYHEKIYMVIGASSRKKAMLLLYQSENKKLDAWTYKGIMLERPLDELPFFECPRVMLFGEKLVILYSPYKQVEYVSGSFEESAGRFREEQRGYVDWGKVAYASVGAKNENGEICLLSWAPGWFSEKKFVFEAWNGCMCLPRQIRLDKNGKLIQMPARQIEMLRGQPAQWEYDGKAGWKTQIQGTQFEFYLLSRQIPKETWELWCYDLDTGQSVQRVTVENKKYKIGNHEIPIVGKELELRCYSDGFLWEFFLDGGRAVLTEGAVHIPKRMGIHIRFLEPYNGDLENLFTPNLWKILDAKYQDCMYNN